MYICIPTNEELLSLAKKRSDACVSIYLKTSPLPQTIQENKIDLNNQIKSAIGQLEEYPIEKHRIEDLKDQIASVIEPDEFWRYHANSLAILATPDSIRVYRMANEVKTKFTVADRFYLKPLFRAVTFPHTAYLLALSENETRVVELLPDAHPEEVSVPNMPTDALSAIGRSSLVDATAKGPTRSGSHGKKLRLTQYAKKVDDALRPFLLATHFPLILVSTDPLASIYRSVCSLPNLVDETVFISPDRVSLTELSAMARPVLDNYYANQLIEIKALFEERTGQNRVTIDWADTAWAATHGMIGLLLVDFEQSVKGSIDEAGKLSLSEDPDAHDVLDEIVRRALESGAKILAVRANDMVGDTGIAAILRYTVSFEQQ